MILPKKKAVEIEQQQTEPEVTSRSSPFAQQTIRTMHEWEHPFTDPQTGFNVLTGKYEGRTEEETKGSAIPMNVGDVLNVAELGLEVGMVGYGLYKLPSRMAISRSLVSREAIEKEAFSFGRNPLKKYETATFRENVMAPLEVQPQAETWFIKTRGTPTTPMSKTLEAAVSRGRSLGGLAGTQQIVVSDYEMSKWIMSPALREIQMVPKVMPVSRLGQTAAGLIIPSVIRRTAPSQFSRSALVQESKVTQQLKQGQKQIQRQIQQQQQRQKQQLYVYTPQKLRQTPIQQFPRYKIPTTRMNQKAMKQFGIRWRFIRHPIPSARQVAKRIGITPMRKRKRGRNPWLL